MKTLKRYFSVLLTVAVLMTGCQENSAKKNIVSSVRYIGQMRGFFVTSEELENSAEVVSFAGRGKFNAVFAESEAGKAQSLGFLCSEAKKRDVQIFAVLSPFAQEDEMPDPASPEFVKALSVDAAAIAKEYDVAGIIISGLDVAFMQGSEVAEAVKKLTEAVSKAVKRADRTTAVGIAFDATNEHNAMTIEAAEGLAQAHCIDIVMPYMNTSMEYKGDTGYLPLLTAWTAADFAEAVLYIGNVYTEDDPYRMQNQLLANAVNGGVDGAVLSPYGAFAKQDGMETEMLMSLFGSGENFSALDDLTFPQTLAINYPQGNITVYDDAIYIMGTSDPTLPLTTDGANIPRTGEKGAYGVKIDLAVGENIITVEQGGAKASVTVTRGSAPESVVPIKQITDATLFPQTPLGLDSNETLKISCVGPAGASITATLGGKTVIMSQTAQTKAKGTPASFSGSTTLNPADYPADKVTNIGKITYVVSQGEANEVQTSPAEVFVAGMTVPLTLEIPAWSYVASVLTDLTSDNNFTQTLKAGGRAAIKGRTQTVRGGNPVIAYKLENGGYILGSRANIVEDANHCINNITEIIKTVDDDGECYEFRGGQPAVLTERTDTTLKLKFLNSKLAADHQSMTGGITQKAERTDTVGGTELLLTFQAGSLWGYDIVHQDGATTLRLRRTPKPSEAFGKPLEGIKIMLDPGHGGADPGALGIAGSTGPTEAILNMSVAKMAKFRLEQLGASVTLTRTDESRKVTLDERTFMAEKQQPHIFMSIHHNSTAPVKDLKDVRHMEAYYREQTAREFSDSLMKHLTDTLQRKPSESKNAYYYVTRLTFAPAVLFEMGFIVNPAEYENACDTVSMYKAANGIAMAIVDIVK